MQLKVMSFNLRTDVAEDGSNAWQYRTDHALQVIHQAQPDFIGTQEGLQHMLDELQQSLPDYRWIGKPRQALQLNEHCAVFHRHAAFTASSDGTFWISETPDVPGSIGWGAHWPRICTWVTYTSVEDPSKQVRLYNVHLDHFSENARLEGLKYVWSVIEQHWQKDALPFIITGDFNTEPHTPPIQWIHEATMQDGSIKVQDAYSLLHQESLPIGRTYHNFEGGVEGEPIDFIFVSSDLKIIATEILRDSMDGRFPSDHYPIVCTIEL